MRRERRSFFYSTLAEEADEATNLEDSASDIEKSTVEKVAIVAKGEAAKASKTDTNLEKFNCDQCNCTNSPEKGLTQHMRMKHCHKVDIRCLRQDHVDLCCEVIAVGI